MLSLGQSCNQAQIPDRGDLLEPFPDLDDHLAQTPNLDGLLEQTLDLGDHLVQTPDLGDLLEQTQDLDGPQSSFLAKILSQDGLQEQNQDLGGLLGNLVARHPKPNLK